jgi:O-antigen/teichoic acid export membrane protein
MNILAIAGSDVGRRILGFLAVAYLARTVGPSGFGLVNIAFAVLSYAMMLSGGGLPAYGARSIAKGGPASIAATITGVRLALSVVLVAIIGAGTFLFVPDKEAALVITIFCASQVATSFLLDWYFQGKEQMGVIGVSRLVSAAVYLLFLVMFVSSRAEIVWVAVAAVAGDAMAALVTVARFQKEQGRAPGMSLEGGAKLFREAFPIGLGSIIAHMTVNLPTLVVGIFLSTADAGVYSAAGKLVAFLLVFDRLLATLLLPASSRLYAESPERLSAVLSSALRWVLRIALPLCVGATLLADELIATVYGGGYAEAGLVLRILVWFLLLTMLHTVYTSALLAAGEERRYGRVMVTSGVFYLVAVLFSTWRYGVAGAAVAIVAAELATLALMRTEAAQHARMTLGWPAAASAIAAVVMGAAVALAPGIPLAGRIALGAAVYAVALFALRGITRADFVVPGAGGVR